MSLTQIVKPSVKGIESGYAIALGSVAGPTSYAAGGWAESLADLGVDSDLTAKAVLVMATRGYGAEYDLAAGKVKAYSGTTEVAAGTDLSGVIFVVMAVY